MKKHEISKSCKFYKKINDFENLVLSRPTETRDLYVLSYGAKDVNFKMFL